MPGKQLSTYLTCGYKAESILLLPAMPFPCLPSPVSGGGAHGEGWSSLLLGQDTSVPIPHTTHNPKELKKKKVKIKEIKGQTLPPLIQLFLPKFWPTSRDSVAKTPLPDEKKIITLTRAQDDSQFCQSQRVFKIPCLPYSKQVSFSERHLKPTRFTILAFP